MPVPQKINFLASQASCLLLTMVQDLSRNKLNYDTAYIRLPTEQLL
jgi:formiminotetrahydrofolate cyclodeaminase